MPLRPLVVALTVVVALASLAGISSAQTVGSIPNGNGCQQVTPTGPETPIASSLLAPAVQAGQWFRTTVLARLSDLFPQAWSEAVAARLERPTRVAGAVASGRSWRIR